MTDRVVHVEHIWGTVVSIDVRTHRTLELDCTAAIKEVVQWLRHVDAVFSTYKADSVVSQLRDGRITEAEVDSGVRDVLNRCHTIKKLTNGAFDPWAAEGGFDPSGLVKGWAADRASHILLDHGFKDFMINAGGDVVVRGESEPGQLWSIGISHPHDTSTICDYVIVNNMSVATSGDYERGAHIVSPHGTPIECISATVIGQDAATADALATALLIDGKAAMDWFSAFPNWSGHFIIGDKTFSFGPAFN